MEGTDSRPGEDLVDDEQDRRFVLDNNEFTRIKDHEAHTLNFLDVSLQNYRQITVIVQLENILEPEHTFRRLRTEHVDTLVAEFKEKGYLESVGMLSVAIAEGKGDANPGKWNELRRVLEEGRGRELPECVTVCLIDGRHRLAAMNSLMKTSKVWKKKFTRMSVKLWTTNNSIGTSRAELLGLSGALNRASATVEAPTFQDHVHAAVSLAHLLRARADIGERLSTNLLACALSKCKALGRMGPRQTLRYAQVAFKLSGSKRNFDSFVAVSTSCKKLALVHLCNNYLLNETTEEQFSLSLQAVAGKVDAGLEQSFQSFSTQFYAMLRQLLKEVSFAAERMGLSFRDVLKMEAPVGQRYRVKIANLIVRTMTAYKSHCYRPEASHLIRIRKFQTKLIDALGVDYRVCEESPSQECTARKSSTRKPRLKIPRRRISTTLTRLARHRSHTVYASSRRADLGNSDGSASEFEHFDSDSERSSSHQGGENDPSDTFHISALHPHEKKRKVCSGDLDRRAIGTGDEEYSNALGNHPVTAPPPGQEENTSEALPHSTASPPKKHKVISGDLVRRTKGTEDEGHSDALENPLVAPLPQRSTAFRLHGAGKNKSHLLQTLSVHLPTDAAPVKERLSTKPPTVSEAQVWDRLSAPQRQVSKGVEKEKRKKHKAEVEFADDTEFKDVLPDILPFGVNDPKPYVDRGKYEPWVRHAVCPPSRWSRKNPIAHATPFLDAIFIPHEHRANVVLCDPAILRANHHMVFWRAAYNHHATNASQASDTRHTWKQAFMEDEASLTYFGRRREQVLQRGYAILEGFLADESVPADLLKKFPIEVCNFFLPLHKAVHNSFQKFSNNVGNKQDWTSTVHGASKIDSSGGQHGIVQYQSTLHNVTTAIEEDASVVWMCASRSLLDARISQCMAALCLWTNTKRIGYEDIDFRPRMYTPKTGGRWLVTSRGCLRQQLHTDFEVQCRLDDEEALLLDEEKENPGFFTLTTAADAGVLWVCPFSHYLVPTAEEKSLQALSTSLKAVKVIIPPFSIFVGRGDMLHADGAFEDHVTGNHKLHYSLYFVPENRKLTKLGYCQHKFNPEFKMYKESKYEDEETKEGP